MVFFQKNLVAVALLVLLAPCYAEYAPVSEFKIEVEKPTFVLPQFTGAFRVREASIAPEEREMAERLKSLLDAENQDKVLSDLEAFYDIELSPAMLTLKAQVYFSQKMYGKAEKTYLAVLKRKPQLVRVHGDLGQLYMIQDEFDKAREHFAKAVAYGSNEAMIHGQLAYLNLRTHGPYSAISEYQQAMALEPDNPQWQQGLLAALSQAKMYEAAQALLTEQLNKNPKEVDLWLNQAALALQMENMGKALTSLEMAVLLGDRDLRNLRTAAKLHLQQNSHDRAVSLLKQTMDQKGFDVGSVNEYLQWLIQLDMWEQAERLMSDSMQRVVQMDGDEQSRFYMHRAMIEAHKGKHGEADRYFAESLEKNPANGDALLSYARFCNERENHVKAELLYMRAESIPGLEKEAMLERSQVYVDMQDYSSALKHMRLTYQKFPDTPGLRENIETVENIVRTRKETGD